NGKQRMANGELKAMANDEWRMANGDGERRMTHGKWQTANGERRMTHGKWQTANGERRMTHGEW
ncbi:hypothetical protein PAXINDRAFT_42977, partial [Paxillus involutus ATCC 200175]